MQYIVIFLIFVSSCLPDSGGGTQEGTGSQEFKELVSKISARKPKL